MWKSKKGERKRFFIGKENRELEIMKTKREILKRKKTSHVTVHSKTFTKMETLFRSMIH